MKFQHSSFNDITKDWPSGEIVDYTTKILFSFSFLQLSLHIGNWWIGEGNFHSLMINKAAGNRNQGRNSYASMWTQQTRNDRTKVSTRVFAYKRTISWGTVLLSKAPTKFLTRAILLPYNYKFSIVVIRIIFLCNLQIFRSRKKDED